jgi:hypothetical protein
MYGDGLLFQLAAPSGETDIWQEVGHVLFVLFGDEAGEVFLNPVNHRWEWGYGR